jgi:hypothetical protein
MSDPPRQVADEETAGEEDSRNAKIERRTRELLCLLGLTPFLVHFVIIGSVVAFVVFFNGIVYHGFFSDNRLVKIFDILCNTALTIWVNVAAMNPTVTSLTAFAVACFALNVALKLPGHANSLIHVLGVQAPLFGALFVAETRGPFIRSHETPGSYVVS